MIETLSHPAREITIPYIQSIGYVYIPICRDVINSERDDSITGKIANYIKPALIIVPAFSTSHDRFIKPLDRFVRIHRSCVVLCNCCSCAKGEYVGLVGVPQQGQDVHDIKMNARPMMRGECAGTCASDKKNCVFYANITNEVSHTNDTLRFSLSQG